MFFASEKVNPRRLAYITRKMDVIFAHDPVRRAIFAHLAFDLKLHEQSATLLAPYRFVSRAWRAAIPAPPKYSAHVNAPDEWPMNPAACGDPVAFDVMFYQASIDRWVYMWYNKYDEQSAKIRARFGASCGIEPMRRQFMGLYIGFASERVGLIGCDVHIDKIPVEGSKNKTMRRMFACDRVAELVKSRGFSRDLDEVIRARWDIPVESKLILLRESRNLAIGDRKNIAQLRVIQWSILNDRELIRYCARDEHDWCMNAREYRRFIIDLCTRHIEDTNDAKRVMRRARGWNFLSTTDYIDWVSPYVVSIHMKMWGKFMSLMIERQKKIAKRVKRRARFAPVMRRLPEQQASSDRLREEVPALPH